MIQLVIGNKNYSTWSLRAWLTLHKAGIAFQEIKVPLYVEGYKDELFRHSPAGLVPIFKEDDFVIWDSFAICEFIAEMHPELWPLDSRQRAQARAVCAEMHSGFRGIRGQIPMNCRATHRRVEFSSEVLSEIRRVESIWTQCRLQASVEGHWLFGRFTIADAMFVPLVLHFQTYGVTMNEVCTAYMKAVLNDPVVKSWVEGALLENEIIQECEVGTD
jgi:glutathione S-transferase